jgi:hypothetical protein
MRKWLILAAVVVAASFAIALAYVDVYARPVFLTMDGKPFLCWPQDMGHVWQRAHRSTFACVPVDRAVWVERGKKRDALPVKGVGVL